MKKENRIKRLTAITLCLILALSMAATAYAATYSGRVQVGGAYRYFDDRHTWKVYNSSSIKTFYPSSGGSAEAYCLTPQAAAGNASYTDGNWSGYSYNVQRAINLTMAYGSGGIFDYSAYDVYGHFATQMIIWEFVLGYRDPVTFEVDPAHEYCDRIFVDRTDGFSGYWVQTLYDQIVSLLQSHGTIPSFAVPFRRMLTEDNAIKLTWDGTNYSAMVTDSNWVLYDYAFSCSIPGVTMSQTQNKLTITATKAAAEQLTSSYASTAYGWCIDEASCDSVMLVSGNLQNVCALMNESDPVPAYMHFMVEKPTTGSLTIQKVDSETNVPLSGVRYQLYDDGGVLVGEAETNADGQVVFADLPLGSYTYKEVSTAEGYYLDETVYAVTLTEGTTDVTETRTNTPRKASIQIAKVDAAGTALEGVAFLLESSADEGATWTEVRKTTTNELGLASFTDLPANSRTLYRVTETETTPGQSLLPSPLFVGSLPDGDVYDIHITACNSPHLQLPFTGGCGFTPTILFAALAVMAGVFYCNKFKNKKEKSK